MPKNATSVTNRNGRWNFSRAEAIAFLESPRGALLHELGHHAAANMLVPVAGHLIVERSTRVSRGAFVISTALSARPPSAEYHALTLASGALAELEFLGLTNSRRLASDFAAFKDLLTIASPRLSPAFLLGYWKTNYQTDFSSLVEFIGKNFARCQRLIEEGSYRIEQYDVIPTHILEAKAERYRLPKNAEVDITEQLGARREALKIYLAARAV